MYAYSIGYQCYSCYDNYDHHINVNVTPSQTWSVLDLVDIMPGYVKLIRDHVSIFISSEEFERNWKCCKNEKENER